MTDLVIIEDQKKLNEVFSRFCKYGDHKLVVNTNVYDMNHCAVAIWCSDCKAFTKKSLLNKLSFQINPINSAAETLKRLFDEFKTDHPDSCELVRVRDLMES